MPCWPCAKRTRAHTAQRVRGGERWACSLTAPRSSLLQRALPPCRYRPNVSLAFVRDTFQMESPDALDELLEDLGAVVVDGVLDTKGSLPAVSAKAKTFARVDIKGQL